MKELYTTPELLMIPCAIEDILTVSVKTDTGNDYGPIHPV